MKKIVFLGFVILSLFFGNVLETQATQRTKLFGRNLELSGYLRQESGFSTCDDAHLLSAYSTLWFEADYHPSDVLDLHMILNPTYDSAYEINDGCDWWESAEPSYYPMGSIKNQDPGDSYDYQPGYDEYSDDDMEFYDDYLLRELYAKIDLGELVFRVGRQTEGWGRTDGIRIMDMINPLDLSRENVLRDSGFEETRIPLWMLKTSYYPYPKISLGKLDISAFQFYVIPDIETTRLGMRTDGPVRGLLHNGVWGLRQPILPGYITEVPIDLQKRDDDWDNTEFAGRIIGDISGWTVTLNFFYGYEDDFVADAKGIGLLTHTNGNLREVNRLTPQQVAASGLNDHMVHYLEQHGTAGTQFEGIEQLRAYFDGEYYRKKVIGMSCNKELGFLSFRQTSPVLRFEGTYQFDKAFNTDGDNWGDLAWLKPNGIVKRDQIKYMLGLDWPIRLPALNSRNSFFTSLQFIQFIIPNYDKKLFHAPYYYDDVKSGVTERDPYEIPQWQNFFTIKVSTDYYIDKLSPSVLFGQAFDSDSYFVEPKIKYKHGMHWREEIGAHIYGGDNSFHGFGMFDDRDQVYFKLKYQF